MSTSKWHPYPTHTNPTPHPTPALTFLPPFPLQPVLLHTAFAALPLFPAPAREALVKQGVARAGAHSCGAMRGLSRRLNSSRA
eukprot:351017-Chlamydomonas_euryale.AAC.3